jgi:murein DD-endopeptidase MepM/ murein hydrolase activator NlpD
LCIVLPVQAAPEHPPAAQPDPRAETLHVVKPGETLGGIAATAGVAKVLIIEANGLVEPYGVKIGQKLVIPRQRTHTVKPGETSFGIALDLGIPWNAIAAANALDPKAPLKSGQTLAIPSLIAAKAAPSAKSPPTKPMVKADPANPPLPQPAPTKTAATKAAAPPAPPPTSGTPATLPADTLAPRMIWPVRGEIRRGFTPRGGTAVYHDGIDIAAASGTPVRAAAEGKVIFAGTGPKEYGLTVIVYHSGRWTTTYGALGKLLVKDGEHVRKGQQIGLAGQTGIAIAPQLHFEVRRNRIALDPAGYLPDLAAQAM